MEEAKQAYQAEDKRFWGARCRAQHHLTESEEQHHTPRACQGIDPSSIGIALFAPGVTVKRTDPDRKSTVPATPMP